MWWRLVVVDMRNIKPSELKYPVILKNMSGMIVVALGVGENEYINVRCKIIDNNGAVYYRNGDTVNNAMLSLFEKYNKPVKLRDGTVLQNVV